MDIETQAKFQQIILSDFESMKKMLDTIKEKISEYPVYTQLEFIKPLKHMVVEAFTDAINKDDNFLNNYNSGEDSITV